MSVEGRRSADSALLAALATGKTHEEAAELVGLSTKTIGRRLREPNFQSQLADARRAVVASAIEKLSASMARAATRLDELLDARSEHVQLRAAIAILELSDRFNQIRELDARVAALEAAWLE